MGWQGGNAVVDFALDLGDVLGKRRRLVTHFRELLHPWGVCSDRILLQEMRSGGHTATRFSLSNGQPYGKEDPALPA
jgi:hypothetical protein